MADHHAGYEKLSGEVEVDGAYFGDHVRPENRKLDRRDRRLREHRSGKRKVVAVARERHGRTYVTVEQREADAVANLVRRIKSETVVYADEAAGWDDFHVYFDTRRINHSEAYSKDRASTNWAESFFSRIRRAEIGIYHRISARYLAAYAGEMAWREDGRRIGNKAQLMSALALGLEHGVSRTWKGYWRSNFTKYFALHLRSLGLKKLISTSFAPISKRVPTPAEPNLFERKHPTSMKTYRSIAAGSSCWTERM